MGELYPLWLKKSQQVFSQVTPNLPQGNRSSQAHTSSPSFLGIRSALRFGRNWSTIVLKGSCNKRVACPAQPKSLRKRCRLRVIPQGLVKALVKKGPSSLSGGLGKSNPDAQKMRPWYPARIPPGKHLCQNVKQSMGRVLKDLYMISTNPPVQVPSTKPELERVELRQEASKSPGGPYKREGTADA